MTATRSSVLAALILGLVGPAGAQQTTVRGFTDVSAVTGSAQEPSGFRLGQFDVFVNSKIGPKLSFLGETVFEADGNEFVVDIERIIVTYAVSRQFQLTGGRHHTPIGYWNTAYHHGNLMQPTIERPAMFRFEDEGGALPVHTLGLGVAGREVSALRLGYDVLIGNGIGANSGGDHNSAKSLSISVHSQVTSTTRLGVSHFTDRIPAGTATVGGAPLTEPVRQRIWGAFAAHFGPRVEALAEYQRVENGTKGTPGHVATLAMGYLGIHLGQWTPYGRYDRLRFDLGDRYFHVPNETGALVGLRVDVSAFAAVKVELQHVAAGFDGSTRLAAQIALGF